MAVTGTCFAEFCMQHRKDIDLLEQVQKRDTKLIRGMKAFSFEERLRGFGLLTWKREGFGVT